MIDVRFTLLDKNTGSKSKEKEKELGVSKPIIDIAALEKEAEELARQKKGGNK